MYMLYRYVFVLLNNDLFLNSYYGGYMFSVYGVEPSYNTGYGAFSKILFAAIVFCLSCSRRLKIML